MVKISDSKAVDRAYCTECPIKFPECYSTCLIGRVMSTEYVHAASRRLLSGEYLDMEWHNIDTIPKDQGEVLVCNVNQGSILHLVSWNKVHAYWHIKGEIDLSFQWTHWTPITNTPRKEK